jgi:hypothetical protein
MLAIDLQEFKFYLKEQDSIVDKSEGLFIGWLLVLISDIAMMFVYFLKYLANKIKKISSPKC